jgi:DNA end-binding protein Ku
MREDDRVGIAKVSFRDKEHIAALRFKDDAFVLETMFWPDEIRSTGMLDLPEGKKADVNVKEMQMARSLIDNLSAKFDPGEYHDEYRAALEELIEHKMKGEERVARRRKPEPSVVDLMDALRQSVAASRAKKGTAGNQAGERKPARKKNARRKAA